MIKAIITTNESSSPNISLNYVPLIMKSEESLRGPMDKINLSVIVVTLTGAFICMLMLISMLILKLIKFEGLGDELPEAAPPARKAN